jgi:hypothetical protein
LYFSLFLDPRIFTKSAIRCVLGWSLLNKIQVLTLLSRNLYGGCPEYSEYEIHQVEPKDYGSQTFSFLACKKEAVGVVKKFANGNGAWQTEIFLSLKSRFFALKSTKTWKTATIFSFIPSLNQYFLHIPYVASKSNKDFYLSRAVAAATTYSPDHKT